MCQCPEGTEGEYCQDDFRMDCSLNPCLSGKCDVLAGGKGYVCRCPASKTGKNCERERLDDVSYKMRFRRNFCHVIIL